MEEALGVDLNKDGRIGGPGPLAQVERATHVDLNRDGIIGGYRPSASGGTHSSVIDERLKGKHLSLSLSLLGLIGKIESATHIDLNHDGRIGGTANYYPRPH